MISVIIQNLKPSCDLSAASSAVLYHTCPNAQSAYQIWRAHWNFIKIFDISKI